MWGSSGSSRLIAPSSALPSASASQAAVPSLPPVPPSSPSAPASEAPPVTPGPPALLPPSFVSRTGAALTGRAYDPSLPVGPWPPAAVSTSGPMALATGSKSGPCSSASRNSLAAVCVAVSTSLPLPPLLLGPPPERDSCTKDPATSDCTAGNGGASLPLLLLRALLLAVGDVEMPRRADDGYMDAAALLAGAAPAGEPRGAADPRLPGTLPSKSIISSCSSQLPRPMLWLS